MGLAKKSVLRIVAEGLVQICGTGHGLDAVPYAVDRQREKA